MERRVFLAIVLAALVMYGWQALFVPPVPPPGTEPRTDIGAATPPPATPAAPVPAPAPAPAADADPAPAAITSDAEEREIVVQTPLFEAVLTNRGGRLLHWRLANYRDEEGEAVDLVPSGVPEGESFPFSLRVDDPAVTGRLNTALYRVTGATGDRVDATAGPATVIFEFQDASGLRVAKRFTFEPESYVVVFSTETSLGDQPLNPMIDMGPGLGDAGALSGGGSFFTGNYVQPPQAIYHRDGDVERWQPDDLVTQPAHEGVFRFAGVDDHYFIAAAINPGQVRLEYRPLALPAAAEMQRLLLAYTIRFPQPPQEIRY